MLRKMGVNVGKKQGKCWENVGKSRVNVEENWGKCWEKSPLKKSRLHFFIQIVAQCSETNEKSIFQFFLRYGGSKIEKQYLFG